MLLNHPPTALDMHGHHDIYRVRIRYSPDALLHATLPLSVSLPSAEPSTPRSLGLLPPAPNRSHRPSGPQIPLSYGLSREKEKRRSYASKIISSPDTRQIALTLQMASFNDQRRLYPSRATSTVAGLSKPMSLASRAVNMPQYMTREGGDPTQIKRSKQGMADLKLRRLMELNNRLREDLDRERIPVSTASKR